MRFDRSLYNGNNQLSSPSTMIYQSERAAPSHRMIYEYIREWVALTWPVTAYKFHGWHDVQRFFCSTE